MPETPPRNTFRNLVRLSQYNDYKRLTKYPLDTAFSEKALIIDIYGESGEASRGTSVESRGAILLRAARLRRDDGNRWLVANKRFLWRANFMLDILKKVYKIDI
jgi:hypothetical protein